MSGPIVRVCAFLALLVCVDFWLVRHWGLSVERALAVGGVTALISTGLGWIEHGLPGGGDWLKKRLEALGGRVARLLLAAPTLVVLYCAAALVMFSCSSIQLVTTNTSELRSIRVRRLGAGGVGGGRAFSSRRELETVRVWTTPFGSMHEVDVSGRLPHLVRVPPLAGATVPIDDLDRVPAILLRLPPEASMSLSDSNWVSVWRAGKRVVHALAPGEAFSLGRPSPPREQHVAAWRGDLLLARVEEARTTETYLRRWRAPSALPGAALFLPDDSLYVTVCTTASKLVAEARFVVTSDDLVDVLLTYVPEDRQCPR